MKVTSALANKILTKLTTQYEALICAEQQAYVFNAALGEDVASVRPNYDFADTQKKLALLSEKIRKLKHLINVFNTVTVVPEINMTIDGVLVLLPQLTNQKRKLNQMKSRLPKVRDHSFGMRSTVIDYVYANYSIEEATTEYERVSDYLSKVQTALDVVNNTVEFDIPDDLVI